VPDQVILPTADINQGHLSAVAEQLSDLFHPDEVNGHLASRHWHLTPLRESHGQGMGENNTGNPPKTHQPDLLISRPGTIAASV